MATAIKKRKENSWAVATPSFDAIIVAISPLGEDRLSGDQQAISQMSGDERSIIVAVNLPGGGR